mgnify:CR=1 FL=1
MDTSKILGGVSGKISGNGEINQFYFIYLAIAFFVIYIVIALIKRTLKRVLEQKQEGQEKNKQTILNVTNHALTALGIGVFIVYALSPFINFDKLLAGAGILGLIVGFASQNMLKDLIAGIFRISTKQIRQGDLVMINGKMRGRVEEIGVLYLQIREWDGRLTTFNNGEVREIQNFNMDKMRIIVDVVVSFRENPARVLEVLESVCATLNAEHSHLLLEGEETETYQVYGLTSTNEMFYGYKYSIVGLVRDDVYFEALNHARLLVAQAMYDNHILMAEQHIYYKTRADKRECPQ